MPAKKTKAIVITGDVIASSKLTNLQRRRLQERIDRIAGVAKKKYPDMQFQQYRGDSLQATLRQSRQHGLNLALQLECFLIAAGFHLRVGVGVGEITFESRDVITSDGSAFQLSGPLVDELKKRNDLIAITASDESFAAEWRVHSESLNFLLRRLSAAQADALYLLFENMKQEEIAKMLKISQPSVHQRLQAAGVQVFTSIMQRFETTVPLL